jgi:hypothetical protein
MYYLTQEYIFRCIDKNTYEPDLYIKGFPANDDNLYQILIKIGYDENQKLYFPFIRYQKQKKHFQYIYIDGTLMSEYISDKGEKIIEDYGGMFDNCVFKNYGDIYINYDTLEDVYNFIRTLLIEFPKDTTVPQDSIFKIGSSNDFKKKTQFVNKLVYFDTHFTIPEFTLEYFINKLDNIIYIDKNIHLFSQDCLNEMIAPMHALAVPWENKDKMILDYPNLNKCL